MCIKNVFLFPVKLMRPFALGRSKSDIPTIKESITPGILINFKSIYLSIYLSICLSVCLSVYMQHNTKY